MRMCRRLGAGGHGNVEVPVTSIQTFRATGRGSNTVMPYGTQGSVGAFTGSASALIYTNTRINFTLKRRTKRITISATWNSGSPNPPNYAAVYTGEYPESRAVYYYNDYITRNAVTIANRSVTTELIPDEPLPAGDYCIYFYATPDGAGGVSGLPAEQVSISAKV